MLYWVPSLAEVASRGQRIPPAHTPAAAPSGLEGLISQKTQRIRRVAVFAQELARNLRREYGALWLPPQPGRTPLAAEAQLRVNTFVRRVNLLAEKAAEAERYLASVQSQNTGERLRLLNAFDAEAIAKAAQGIEAQAAEVRELLAGAPKPAPSPRAKTGSLRELFHKLTEPVAVEALPAEKPAPPPAFERARQAFDAAFALAKGVLEYVSPRLRLFQVALDATGLPGPKRPWEAVTAALRPSAEAAGVAPSQFPWLTVLAKLYYQDLAAVQKTHVAITQWQEASGLHDEAQLLVSTLASAEPAHAPRLLAQFDLPRYRAATYPISHLHVAFKGIGHLQTFFPPPAS